MTDRPQNVTDLDKILLQRLKAKQRQVAAYRALLAAGSLNFDAAVAIAKDRLAEASTADPGGPGADFLDALYFLSTYLPRDYSEADLERLIEQAATDPRAYQVLRLIDHISPKDARFPSLKRWREESYLGLFVPPADRRGVGKRKYAQRNALIVGEIHALVSVGFQPMRNEVSPATSACDVVATALALLGRSLTYSAVASVWNNRDKMPKHDLLMDLFDQMIGRDL